MGSAISRHLRDLAALADVGGFEGANGNSPSPPRAEAEATATARPSASCPATPTANQPVRLLDFDPRSPTAEIVRTPIEVWSKQSWTTVDSPMATAMPSRRSYLETDLDTLSTSETIGKPENTLDDSSHSLPPGLSSAHIMKLRFLGVDPRSPASNDVVRTPIQVGKSNCRDVSPILFNDSLSVGSISSHDLFNNSMCSSEFTRDCSDPSAFVSEIDDMSDREDEDVIDKVKEVALDSTDILKDDIDEPVSMKESSPNSEGPAKSASKLLVFQEDNQKCEIDVKQTPATPEATKKATGNHSRTPLTPICNRNRTPNSILRAKQSQTIEKEILTKVKIYSMDESRLTPSKIRSLSNGKKENAVIRSARKGNSNNDENAPAGPKKKVLAQWDQDTSVII